MPLLAKILIGFGFINFFATPTLIVLPLYIKNTLHGSASLLGFLEASLWVGLITGTFSSKYFNFEESTLKLGGYCLVLFGLSLLLPGFVVNQTVYIVCLFATGFTLGLNNVKFISLFQKIVPDSLKGRFFAILQAVIGFTFPISFFLFGFLGDILSAPQLCIIQGFGVTSLAFVYFYLAKQEGEFDSYIRVFAVKKSAEAVL